MDSLENRTYVHFSITLTILVTEAKNLVGGSKAKPYIKINYMGLKIKTKHIKYTLNPTW